MSVLQSQLTDHRAPALDIKNVTRVFPGEGGKEVRAVDDVSLTVEQGEFVVLVGHNGSGKTTLFDLVGGALEPDEGTITINSHEHIPGHTVTSRVRQSPGDGAFAELTVLENFWLFTLKGSPSPLKGTPPNAVVEETKQRLEPYGLSDRMHQKVQHLSEGQRQLLALELAMAREPSILLLDEHTASLDQKNANRCMDASLKIAGESGTTVLMITHNFTYALRYGDRLIVMNEGRIEHSFSGEDKKKLTLESLLDFCGYI